MSLQIPGEMKVELERRDRENGSLSVPHFLIMQRPGMAKILAMGGLTRLEYMAGMIAGHFIGVEDEYAMAAKESVAFAEAILSECKRREGRDEQTKRQAAENGRGDGGIIAG